jgi:hypothetical protein
VKIGGGFGPWQSGVPEAERAARCRGLRALALVYLGLAHPLTVAFGEAIADPATTERVLAELGAVPALRRQSPVGELCRADGNVGSRRHRPLARWCWMCRRRCRHRS